MNTDEDPELYDLTVYNKQKGSILKFFTPKTAAKSKLTAKNENNNDEVKTEIKAEVEKLVGGDKRGSRKNSKTTSKSIETEEDDDEIPLTSKPLTPPTKTLTNYFQPKRLVQVKEEGKCLDNAKRKDSAEDKSIAATDLKTQLTRTIAVEVHSKPYSLGRIFPPSAKEVVHPTIDMVLARGSNLVMKEEGCLKESPVKEQCQRARARTPLSLTDEQKEHSKKELTKIRTQSKLSFGGKASSASSTTEKLGLKAEAPEAEEEEEEGKTEVAKRKTSKVRKKLSGGTKKEKPTETDAKEEKENVPTSKRKIGRPKKVATPEPVTADDDEGSNQSAKEMEAATAREEEKSRPIPHQSASPLPQPTVTSNRRKATLTMQGGTFKVVKEGEEGEVKVEDIKKETGTSQLKNGKGQKRRPSNDKSSKTLSKRRRVVKKEAEEEEETTESNVKAEECPVKEEVEEDEDEGAPCDSLIGLMKRKYQTKSSSDGETIVFVPLSDARSSDAGSDSEVFFTADEDKQEDMEVEEKEKDLEQDSGEEGDEEMEEDEEVEEKEEAAEEEDSQRRSRRSRTQVVCYAEEPPKEKASKVKKREKLSSKSDSGVHSQGSTAMDDGESGSRPSTPSTPMTTDGKTPKRIRRCGECEPCQREDCDVCIYCLDRPRNGGTNSMRQACKERKCLLKSTAKALAANKSESGDEDKKRETKKSKGKNGDEETKMAADEKKKSASTKSKEKSASEEKSKKSAASSSSSSGGKMMASIFLCGKKKDPVKEPPREKTAEELAFEARRSAFLQKGVPACITKEQKKCDSDVKQMQEDLLDDATFFKPLVHVQQREESESLWNLARPDPTRSKLKIREDVYPPLPPPPPPSLQKDRNGDGKYTETYPRSVFKPEINLRRQIAKKQMMLDLSKVHPDGVNGMSTTDFFISYLNRAAPKPDAKALTVVRGRIESGDDEEEEEKKEEEDPSSKTADLSWTEKYRPTKAKEVLGNRSEVKHLADWLDEWKVYGASEAIRDRLKAEREKESDSEYETDSEEESEEEDGLTRLTLLSGGHGIGKTAMIYALAREKGFKVFEVNSSSVRNGKTILKQLQEATQSHHLTRGQATNEKKNNKNKRRSSQGVKGTRRSGRRSSSAIKEAAKEEVNKKTVQLSNLSLILFEEVDILFEERDKGFWSAIHTFVSTTKRPILMTCTDDTRGIPDLHGSGRRDILHVRPVPKDVVSTHLQMIGAAEGIYLNRGEAEALTESCDGDVRKCTNALQFLLSKPDLKLTQQFRVPNSPDHMQLFSHDDANLSEYHVGESYRTAIDSVVEKVHSSERNLTLPRHRDDLKEQLRTFRKMTTEMSLMDVLIGRKRQFKRDLPTISRSSLTSAGSVTHRQFSFHHTDLQNNLLEETDSVSRLDFPAQSNVAAFSRDLCQSMSISMLSRFNWSSENSIRFSSAVTDQRPPVQAAAAVAHQDYSRRLKSTRSCALPYENAMEKDGVALDYIPVLRHLVLSEKERATNCAKRRFTHYFDTIDLDLDDTWTDGGNEKYLLSRFKK